jgi:hypothetical protein
MSKDFLIYLCGIHSVFFALFHISFWKLFRWKIKLQRLNLPNRAIVQILNIRMIHVFLLIAILCFVFPKDLHSTDLGKTFLLGISLFWMGRLIEQFIFLRINNKSIHFLTLLILLGSILFLLPIL